MRRSHKSVVLEGASMPGLRFFAEIIYHISAVEKITDELALSLIGCGPDMDSDPHGPKPHI